MWVNPSMVSTICRVLLAGSSAGSEWADLERAAYEVRDQARRAWRQHGLTADQTAELVAILADASRRISEVLRRSSRG